MPSNNALVRQWKNRQNASLAMIPPLQTYLSRVYKRVEKAVRHSNTMSSLENGKLYVTLTGTLAPAKVFLPGSEEYQKSSGSYFTAFENDIKPSYIAKPSGVQDISELIRALHSLLAGGEYSTLTHCHLMWWPHALRGELQH